MENISKKKVCIVGGGPSGIVSLKRVLESPFLTGTIIEQKDDIGGLWYYKREKGFAASPRNMSGDGASPDPESTTTMYDNLRTNVPYPLMEYVDHKYQEEGMGTYCPQQKVFEYLQSYAKRFNLRPNIQLNTSVVDIRPENPDSPEGHPGKWIVETHNLKTETFSTEIYDAVLICAGKHSYPYQSPIEGQETFKGPIIHTKYYKNAQDFKGKHVVLIGFGPSSADLTLQLSETAEKITVCHKHPFGFNFGLIPKNCRETKTVKRITENGVITEEDEVIACDAIILCTGYAVKYPFLNETCGITVKNEKYIPHLYNMTIFTKRPSLCFVNVCYRSAEFITAEIQARYAISYLEGKTRLPSFEEMEAELQAAEAEKERKGLPYTLWFQIGEFLGTEALPHFFRLAEEIGLGEDYKNGPLLTQMYILLVGRLLGYLAVYRQDKVRKVSENTWELIMAPSEGKKAERIVLTLNPDNTLTTTKEELENETVDVKH
ncbi:Senecionine N-oxygenase [Orchesella cincta]|uniref:Flavin-containing monooxygenase n=1 Tax=Orchesella cincta TaxID=48709 RepID=A0A1D2NB82_ORCCI|nr:Senecionine N-oxygenase [Orchesella cincta]